MFFSFFLSFFFFQLFVLCIARLFIPFSNASTILSSRLRAQFHYAENEIQKLRTAKYKNDKQQLILKEAHQAELTRQKKTYNDLERTFNEQVQEQNLKLKNQQEQHQDQLRNFNELRQALASTYPSGKSWRFLILKSGN